MTTPSTPTQGPVPLGGLLSETFAYCKAHWQPLVAGVVVFGVVMGVVSASLAATAGGAMMKGMNDMGLDTERMQQLAERMEQGDESAMGELEQMLAGEFDGMTDDQIAGRMMGPAAGMMATMVPAIGLSVVVTWILSLLAFAYYAIVAVEGKDMNGTLSRVKSAFFSLFLVNLWSMLRSFIWIPILGLIPAIILGPRFVAAPLIHLAEGKGVTASVSDSYRRTRGYWAKIVGNVIVAMLIAFVATIVLNVALGVVLMASPQAVLIAKQVVSQAVAAYMAVFAVRLSHTILQHPRA
jgi:uncharacterized membrane protein (Fun14 family)